MEQPGSRKTPFYRALMMRSASSTSTEPIIKSGVNTPRDNDSSDLESQLSSTAGSNEDLMTPNSGPGSDEKPKSRNPFAKLKNNRNGVSEKSGPERRKRKKSLIRKLLIAFSVLACFGIIAAVIYVSFVGALIRRLTPPKPTSGLEHIVENWKEPNANGAHQFEWRNDFSRDIVPKNCHSHNDYWRFVPLYQALAAGCSSVEADIWLTDDKELLVSHTPRHSVKERTLRSLYLDPLTNIFTNRNVSVASTEEKEVGMFDVDPNISTVLLIDFKTDGHKIWPILLEQLRPLREKNWLTYFDGSKVVPGPLTIVGTGSTPFELVKENNTNRFVFFDAPLNDIANPAYTRENSYFASMKLRNAIGRIWLNVLTAKQIETLRTQIQAASDKGLVSRYWDTPAWPISLRDRVWSVLTEHDVGMLNVDDLVSATRWNWNWCVIAGFNLCGNS